MKQNYSFNHWLHLAGLVIALMLSQVLVAQAQLYYVLTDGNLATTADQLRRVNLDGTGNVLINQVVHYPNQVVHYPNQVVRFYEETDLRTDY